MITLALISWLDQVVVRHKDHLKIRHDALNHELKSEDDAFLSSDFYNQLRVLVVFYQDTRLPKLEFNNLFNLQIVIAENYYFRKSFLNLEGWKHMKVNERVNWNWELNIVKSRIYLSLALPSSCYRLFALTGYFTYYICIYNLWNLMNSYHFSFLSLQRYHSDFCQHKMLSTRTHSFFYY